MLIIFLLAYYLFIGFRYYKADLLQLFSGRKNSDKNNFAITETIAAIKQRPDEIYMRQSVEDQNLYRLLQSLSDEIQALLGEAGSNKMNKDEIISALKLLLAKYAVLKNSSLCESIQHLIQAECETSCSVRLGEEEVSGLWN